MIGLTNHCLESGELSFVLYFDEFLKKLHWNQSRGGGGGEDIPGTLVSWVTHAIADP